jgi:tRNA threonylcarbamoyladenosine biosynthesis protein TsaB
MLLAIDTCGITGSIALGRWQEGSIVVVAQAELPGKSFSAQLAPRIRELLSAQDAVAGDLEAIVVVNGPGSFTGIRIGVSTAKGLAEALNVPIVAVSRLALLARSAKVEAAALDAGRDEFYYGLYAGQTSFEKLLTSETSKEYALYATAICEARLAGAWPRSVLAPAPNAADALMASAARLLAQDYDEPAILDGNYVRRTGAELFGRPAASRK